MNQPTGHGFLKPEILDEDWIHGELGGTGPQLRGEPLTNGDWTPWLPEEERQAPVYETNDCTGFGSTNEIEVLEYMQYGARTNYSDRALAVMAGTDPLHGNDPQTVYETIRKRGLVPQLAWPNDVSTLIEFFAALPDVIYVLAAKWLGKFDFKHWYVPTNPEALKDALKFSPLGISCALMVGEDGLYYKPDGWRDTHWVALVNFKDGEWWEIFDSYPPFRKKVRWSTNFEVAKRIYLGPATKKSLLQALIDNMLDQLALYYKLLATKV